MNEEIIKKLGWIKEDTEYFGQMYFKINNYLLTFYPPNPNFIEIDNDDKPFQKFIGNIETEKELKVLMKQLGINDTRKY